MRTDSPAEAHRPIVVTVRCSACRTAFPVDPWKVPTDGVEARCSVCEQVFPVPARDALLAGAPPTPAAEARPEAPAPPAPTVPDLAHRPAPTARPTFGRRDPSERAARLARVLVSDMIAYHPIRHREALEGGTLRTEFEDEILRSWKEYVEQVGEGMAENTTYFKDALNEILAGGQEIF